MRAEVIGIGTELLLGDIVNTNASWIGQRLASVGWSCYRHTVVGDNIDRIAEVVRGAMERADAVVLTGGLGPTQDDITREAVSLATGAALHRDERIVGSLRERFASFGREMSEINVRQADVLDGARIIDATFGTAPGLILEHQGATLYLLPGVPREMKEMFERGVLPDLAERGGSAIVSRVVRTMGLSESTVAEKLTPLWEQMQGVTMAFLAGGGEVRVRLTASGDDARLPEAVSAVSAALGASVVGLDEDTLEAVVGAALRRRGWSLAVAESLTGGAMGARITSVAGASDYFRGSLVTYSAEAKSSILGVDPELLSKVGPVDIEVARQMAQGARECLSADVGVSLTGVAGPSDHGGRSAGIVALAVVSPDGEITREIKIPGDRATVRQITVSAGLNLLRLHLLGPA